MDRHGAHLKLDWTRTLLGGVGTRRMDSSFKFLGSLLLIFKSWLKIEQT